MSTSPFFPDTLTGAACLILSSAEPEAKMALSRETAEAWRAGALGRIGDIGPPERPNRPARPVLKAPRDMPKRRAGGTSASRIALLHALAHIELNAIDLAWDLVARFASDDLPRDFFDDWVAIAAEEAKHFGLLSRRLTEMNAAYGDLPAHDGLWEAAGATRHDLLARLAVVPLVLEARGLDVTPSMIAQLGRTGDAESASILRIIYDDEIGHVAAGKRWFDWECARRGHDSIAAFHNLVRRYFKGAVKPPFNQFARDAAGFEAAFYAPLACEPGAEKSVIAGISV